MSATEVETKLRELIQRLHDTDEEAKASLAESLPEPRVLALHVTDLGLHYWTRLVGGHLEDLRQEEPADAHVRIAATSDDLIRLIDGDLSLVSAYLSGRVAVEASFADMLSLRKML